jgi:hypothetical protein
VGFFKRASRTDPRYTYESLWEPGERDVECLEMRAADRSVCTYHWTDRSLILEESDRTFRIPYAAIGAVEVRVPEGVDSFLEPALPLWSVQLRTTPTRVRVVTRSEPHVADDWLFEVPTVACNGGLAAQLTLRALLESAGVSVATF